MRLMNFAQKILKFRDASGWSDTELARRVGVSRSTVGNWISGKRRPYDEALLKLAGVMGMSVDALVDDAAEGDPPGMRSADEEMILEVVRALRLTRGQAIRILLAEAQVQADRRDERDAAGGYDATERDAAEHEATERAATEREAARVPTNAGVMALDPYAEADRRARENEGRNPRGPNGPRR